jgi:uncharacterized protein
MLRLADLGLSGIELVSDVEPDDATSKVGARSKFRVEVDLQDSEPYSVRPESALLELQKLLGAADVRNSPQIELIHHASDSKGAFHIPFRRESAGTKAWLSLAGRILFALRYGETLVVDEIDASLHPRLSATLIQIFRDGELNRRGAQLIFTTHDVSFLGILLDEDLLSRDEVWFTEKGHDGSTTLYSLLDFKPRTSENFERGYLQGRYGALPIVDINEIKRVLARVVRFPGAVEKAEGGP